MLKIILANTGCLFSNKPTRRAGSIFGFAILLSGLQAMAIGDRRFEPTEITTNKFYHTDDKRHSITPGIDSFIPKIHVADWNLVVLPDHSYASYIPPVPLGDINGDGFDDLLYVVTINYPGQGGYVFYGSNSGLSTSPDMILHFGLTYPENYSVYDIKSVGDINGDGYDDLLTNGEYSFRGSQRSEFELPLLYYGSPQGFATPPSRIELRSINYPQNFPVAAPAGDVNGDGYDDIIFSYSDPLNYGYIMHGSSDGPSTPRLWPSPDYYDEGELVELDIYSGDFNNDGFDDVAYYMDQLYIFKGSPQGLSEHHDQAITVFGGSYYWYGTNIISGDFNGDNYADIILTGLSGSTEELGARGTTAFLPGTDSLLDTVNSLIIHEGQTPSLTYLGDINNDNFDDFSLGSTIHFGRIVTDFVPVYFNANTYVFTTANFPFNSLVRIGDVDGSGTPDIYITNAHEQIYYSPAYEPLSFACPDTVMHCFRNSDTFYSIPLLEISNAHIQSIAFSITDSIPKFTFRRSGTTVDASGTFAGDSRISWSVKGFNERWEYCYTHVEFNQFPITSVAIKDAYAVPSKGNPNTFYIGYGATDFRLAALPSGGGAPYNYLWSNGSTEKNPRISETVPGEYPYWVKMTNVHGCASSDTAIIKVENALCSSPLVDVVMSQYPMILQNPVLANLIKSNSKIAVCKDGQTLCFTKAVVDVRITRPGYSIGACTPGVIPAEAFMTDEMEDILRGELKVIVAPNPSSHSFQLSVVSIYNAPVMIRIMDLAGRQVEVLNNVSANQTITVGHKLKAGTYIAEVVSGKERKVVKLVKM